MTSTFGVFTELFSLQFSIDRTSSQSRATYQGEISSFKEGQKKVRTPTELTEVPYRSSPWGAEATLRVPFKG